MIWTELAQLNHHLRMRSPAAGHTSLRARFVTLLSYSPPILAGSMFSKEDLK